jgi:hypothetical protein
VNTAVPPTAADVVMGAVTEGATIGIFEKYVPTKIDEVISE